VFCATILSIVKRLITTLKATHRAVVICRYNWWQFNLQNFV